MDGNKLLLATDRIAVAVQDGRIVQIENKLTGRAHIVSLANTRMSDLSTGLVYVEPGVSERGEKASVIGATLTKEGATVLVPHVRTIEELPVVTWREVSANAVEYVFTSDSGDSCTTIRYSIDAETGDVLVQQSGCGTRKGLSAVRLGLGTVICRGNLLIPAFNGIKASRGDRFYEFESSTWEWPTGWQLQWVAFDDQDGGLWVHARDTQGRFKQVAYNYEGNDAWSVAFDAKNFAPFDDQTTIEPFTWRINAYQGDWTVPSDVYRNWAYRAYKIEEKAKYRPQWIHDIRLVVKDADYVATDHIAPYLDALTKHTVPARTILWLDHWMTTERNRHSIMPNYERLGHHGEAFYHESRKRGFRLMPYTNYTAITLMHPRFEEFKPYCIRSPYSRQLEGWNLHGEFDNWEEVKGIKLCYVNPAYKPWRDFLIGQIRKLFETHPTDALYVDQTFLIFNDDNGLINGQSVHDGNLAFHKELVEALPGVPIAGESINEVTMRYEALCSPWFLGVAESRDSEGKALGWQQLPDAFPRMVPLVTRFLGPHTRLLGGWDVSTPILDPRAPDGVNIYSPIPAIERPTTEQLEDPESVIRRTIDRALMTH